MLHECSAPPRGATDVWRQPSLRSRFSRRDVGYMFIRNTVVSTLAFAVGLLILWLLVERLAIGETVAAGISFVGANALHYAGARYWVFRGTDRAPAQGYFYFLINGGIGLVITIAMFAALMRWTAIHYLVARIVVSIVAGIVMFALNASLNFRRV